MSERTNERTLLTITTIRVDQVMLFCGKNYWIQNTQKSTQGLRDYYNNIIRNMLVFMKELAVWLCFGRLCCALGAALAR